MSNSCGSSSSEAFAAFLGCPIPCLTPADASAVASAKAALDRRDQFAADDIEDFAEILRRCGPWRDAAEVEAPAEPNGFWSDTIGAAMLFDDDETPPPGRQAPPSWRGPANSSWQKKLANHRSAPGAVARCSRALDARWGLSERWQNWRAAYASVRESAREAVARVHKNGAQPAARYSSVPRALAAAVALGPRRRDLTPRNRDAPRTTRALTEVERTFVNDVFQRYADDIDDASRRFREALESAGIITTGGGFRAAEWDAAAEHDENLAAGNVA